MRPAPTAVATDDDAAEPVATSGHSVRFERKLVVWRDHTWPKRTRAGPQRSPQDAPTSWTVHDGTFFANHVRRAEASVPQEWRLVSAGRLHAHSSPRSCSAHNSLSAQRAASPPASHPPPRHRNPVISLRSSPLSGPSTAATLYSYWLLDGIGGVRKPPPFARPLPCLGTVPAAVSGAMARCRIAPLWAWLELGGDVNARGVNQRTLLHDAAAAPFPEGIAALLEAGARVDATQVNGGTPLYFACLPGHQYAVQQLVAAHADVDLPDRHGVTPLMLAARYGRVAVVQALLAAGASLDRRDSAGNTVSSHAQGQRLVMTVLRRHRGKCGASRRRHLTCQRSAPEPRIVLSVVRGP